MGILEREGARGGAVPTKAAAADDGAGDAVVSDGALPLLAVTASEAPEPGKPTRAALDAAHVDFALTAQIIVAWAGEGGEEPRLGWWRTDLVSEFGGQDLFRRLLPHTWAWAVLQAVREAARRKDTELRAKDHDPDQILSLFSLGFELDERLEERLQELKRAGTHPEQALPGLREAMQDTWSRDAFFKWVQSHGPAETVAMPAGRRIKGTTLNEACFNGTAGDGAPSLDAVIRQLLAALAPPSDAYPLPHFRRDT